MHANARCLPCPILPPPLSTHAPPCPQIDQAALTGESLPSKKYTGDVAFSGSVCKQGERHAMVYATGVNTFFGRRVGAGFAGGGGRAGKAGRARVPGGWAGGERGCRRVAGSARWRWGAGGGSGFRREVGREAGSGRGAAGELGGRGWAGHTLHVATACLACVGDVGRWHRPPCELPSTLGVAVARTAAVAAAAPREARHGICVSLAPHS